jgi:hypothetical protein
VVCLLALKKVAASTKEGGKWGSTVFDHCFSMLKRRGCFPPFPLFIGLSVTALINVQGDKQTNKKAHKIAYTHNNLPKKRGLSKRFYFLSVKKRGNNMTVSKRCAVFFFF